MAIGVLLLAVGSVLGKDHGIGSIITLDGGSRVRLSFDVLATA
jgi:hypothetical protein